MRPMMQPMAGGGAGGMMPMQMGGGVMPGGQPVMTAPVTQQPQPQNTNVQLDPFGAL